MVLGSGSDPTFVGAARKLRWLFLFALAAYASWLALRRGQRDSSRLLVWTLASAAWLVALGFASTTWSVDPRLTFGRAASFAVLLVAVGALAFAVRRRPELRTYLLLGILAGAAAAALGGPIAYIFDHHYAVQPASTLYPTRFRGLGQNPNTVALLLGLTAPIALWAISRARGWRQLVLAWAVFLLLMGSITASGSRGPLAAALGGGLIFAVFGTGRRRERAGLAIAITLASVSAAGIMQVPQPIAAHPVLVPSPTGHGFVQSVPPPPGTRLGGGGAGYTGRLQDELYRIEPGKRSLIGSSGRLKAWYTAIQQADARPVLGFGFGTENKVFEYRVYNFQGSYVENSFIGFYLQLGIVGLLSVIVLLGSIAVAALAALRRGGAEGQIAALIGTAVAGFVLMLVESYMYSVGNVATVAFWTSSMLLVSGAGTADVVPVLGRRRRTDVATA
jgi:hypothetical protein